MGQTYEGNYLKLPVSETTNPTPCALKKHKNVCCTTNVISDQIGIMSENMPTVKELDSFDSSVRTQ
jgi:hypothetical protein